MPKDILLMSQNTKIHTTQPYNTFSAYYSLGKQQLPQSHSFFFVAALYIVIRAELLWLVGKLRI